MKTLLLNCVAVGLFALASPYANANPSPIGVTYTVTGTPGDFTLDFSVANNLVGAPNQDFYFFGVNVGTANVTASPATFTSVGGYNPSFFGGANENYDNVWLNESFSGSAVPGTTTSGFEVTIPNAVAPSSVDWFAFTVDNAGASSYTGPGNLNTVTDGAFNPLFEGTATNAATTPEPGFYGLLALGLGGLALFASRRKKTTAV